MKTNPEEFDGFGRDSKWENLVYRYRDWLDDEDIANFNEAMSAMRKEMFTQEVMKELLDPKPQVNHQFNPQPYRMRTGGLTQDQYSESNDINPYAQSQAQQQVYHEQLTQLKVRQALAEQEQQEKLSMLQRILGRK